MSVLDPGGEFFKVDSVLTVFDSVFVILNVLSDCFQEENKEKSDVIIF